MKQKLTSHRRAVGLLLAAAALPFTPAVAQETSPAPAQPPVLEASPPAPTPVPEVARPAPTAAAPAPPAAEEAVPAEQRASRSRARSTASPARRAAPAPAATTSPARAPASASPAPQLAPAPAPATAPLAAAPPASTETTAPAPAPVATAETPAAPTDQPAPASRGSIWPWLLGALVLIGGLALLMRRRRRDEEVFYEEELVEPEVVAAPVMTPRPATETLAPAALAPAAMAPEVAAPAALEAEAPRHDIPAAAGIETGRPAIALEMRPVRAGVNEEDAVVEFELTVDNRGTAPARDVRISTWMFPAGHASEAERALIEPSGQAELPAVTIGEGDAKRIETAVALSTSRISEDAVLPVVVAEAHYRLPDGTEAQTTAAFEVGVPIGDELAHFDLENPSGLHDDVVARPHREAVEA